MHDIDKAMNSQKALHVLPSQISYVVFVVSFLVENIMKMIHYISGWETSAPPLGNASEDMAGWV